MRILIIQNFFVFIGDILAGIVPDDSNPMKWTKNNRPELRSVLSYVPYIQL